MRQHFFQSILLAGTFAALPLNALADLPTVRLESLNGQNSLVGELVDFDGRAYRIRTSLGTFSVASNGVVCKGESCPQRLSQSMPITGPEELTTGLMPSLVHAFATDQNIELTPAKDSNDFKLVMADGFSTDVLFKTQSSTRSIEQLMTDQSGLAVTTRAVNSGELEAFKQRGIEDLETDQLENVIALDGLMIIVSPDNPIQMISLNDVARIYAGQITNWSELGGANRPIAVYKRSANSSTGTTFQEMVMDPRQANISEGAIQLKTDEDVAQWVNGSPNGIGFVSYAHASDAKPLAILGECGVQTPANSFTIKTEEYPLTRRIYMYRTNDRPLLPEGDFWSFSASAAAQRIVTETGFVDQQVTSLSSNNQGTRFMATLLEAGKEFPVEDAQNMVKELLAAERLSLTFRFKQGSSRLDTRGEEDVQRLAQLLSDDRMLNKELVFIGFTDAIGPNDLNQALSEARAASVVKAVRRLAGKEALQNLRLTARGFGEMSPLGCNEDASGRRINRRVEVWVRDLAARG